MLCCLRSVCAVVAGVCLLLQQGLEEMLCGLHEKKTNVMIIDILDEI